MKFCWIVLIGLSFLTPINAQEFLFTVEINAPTLQNVDASLFDELKGKLTEFLNNRNWTKEEYEDHERIKCNLNLTISGELSATTFSADLSIQSIRPVYGSNYETGMVNHIDKEFQFSYEPSTPVIYSENQFSDNLTAVMAFYVYVILGMDYDSFSLYGGDPYYQIANDIVTSVPAAMAQDQRSGWSSKANGRNRYFMIENILNPSVRPFRKAIYDYHRNGLDVMARNAEEGKVAILGALTAIEGVNNSFPNSMVLQMFANAKAQEITDIFTVAARNQKNEVYRIMTTIDPANRNKYIPIRR